MDPLMTVVIPVLIQEEVKAGKKSSKLFEVTDTCIKHLSRNTELALNVLIMDHGSVEWARKELIKLEGYKNIRWLGIQRYESRERGMVDAINESLKKTDTPLIAFIHNDFYILEEKWDKRVYELYNQDSKLGIIGFGGGYGMGPDGYRFGFCSNMVQANVHGVHRWKGHMPAVVLDGMIQIHTRKMLETVKGCSTNYKIHHFYDLHMSAVSVFNGFHNYVLFVRCQHLSGWTRVAKSRNANTLYLHNKKVFMDTWAHRLPVYVESNHKLKQGIPPKVTHDEHFFPAMPKRGHR